MKKALEELEEDSEVNIHLDSFRTTFKKSENAKLRWCTLIQVLKIQKRKDDKRNGAWINNTKKALKELEEGSNVNVHLNSFRATFKKLENAWTTMA